MTKKEILSAISSKLKITALNNMQKEVMTVSETSDNIIILSPTGSGKTLAFCIPVLRSLKPPCGKVQALLIAPTRELVTQIESIIRAIATGYKITACYGGHNMADETQSLSVTPDIVVGTPGRLTDHINRKNIDLHTVRYLVLDEFDKSLELGFQEEMQKIIRKMPGLSKRILSSATPIAEIPDFTGIKTITTLNFLTENDLLRERMTIHRVISDSNDKLDSLLNLLNDIQPGSTIVFANHRESVERIFEFLKSKKLPAGIYHGGLDQHDREKSLAMFNNGTYKILITTDLGSRGLDIAEVYNIIHYHVPSTPETYTHRNGRTARINSSGEIYVITSANEKIPDYMEFDDTKETGAGHGTRFKEEKSTLYFSAGKKEKISKGDILGFLVNQGKTDSSEIGRIDIKDHYSLVAVPSEKAKVILDRIENQKIKNQKVKISIVQ